MQTLDMRISIFNTICKIIYRYAIRLPHNKPLEEFRCVHRGKSRLARIPRIFIVSSFHNGNSSYFHGRGLCKNKGKQSAVDTYFRLKLG